MENKAKEQNQKNDWQKKGLGWVPDYPDLRDYNLGDDEEIKNKLRLKIEEKTGLIENIVELIGLISDSSTQNIEKNRIDDITNKILGTVFFTKVKVHKMFRPVFKDEQTNQKYTLNTPKYESMLSKQIVELKKCLILLVLQEYLLPDEPSSEQSQKDTFVNFKNPAEVVEWMKKDTYDITTEKLVDKFQRCSQIKPDGIAGLETYTTLNEYFSDTEKLLTLKECKPKEITENKSLSKIRFFSVTSLIPTTVLVKILDVFKSKAIEQIQKEYKKIPPEFNNQSLEKNNEKYQTFFEEDFLSKIGVESDFFKKFFEQIPINFWISDIKTNKDSIQIFNELLNAPNDKNKKCALQVSDIIEVLQSSYLFDPIMSVVTKSLSPLAQWRNQTYEELIEKGFNEFERIVFQKKFSKSSKINLGYCQKQLAKDAIFKVVHQLKLEIYSLVEEDKLVKQDINLNETQLHSQNLKEKNKFISTVFFCFLLKKYLNRFEKCIQAAEEAIAGRKEPNPNIFDKQEMFEIEKLVYENKNIPSFQCSNEQEKLEMFLSLNLHISVLSNSLIKELQRSTQQKTQNKKPFFLLPSVVDLSFWCSPVRDQGSLNSCTAFAAIALLEYFANKNSQQKINPSPLFLYKAARNKMNVTKDVGASIRETMKVMALFGVPPEESWSYDSDKVDEEPPPYCYAYAQNYKTLKYFLLDYAGISNESLLFQIKAVLAAGFPCIFGFTLYTSAYEDSNEPGHIPYPDQKNDKVVGGHTAVVVGYDDYKFMLCADRLHYSQGAFLIRNSWGPEWGVNGYGWLPYDYVLAGLTAAWWSLLKSEWFNEDNFGLAGSGGAEGDGEQPASGH